MQARRSRETQPDQAIPLIIDNLVRRSNAADMEIAHFMCCTRLYCLALVNDESNGHLSLPLMIHRTDDDHVRNAANTEGRTDR